MGPALSIVGLPLGKRARGTRQIRRLQPPVVQQPGIRVRRALQHFNLQVQIDSVIGALVGQPVEVEPVVQVPLLDERKEQRHPGMPLVVGLALVDCPRWERPVRAVVVVKAQRDLLDMVGALGTPCRLAGRLHRRQQQRDEDPDDRDHHQQFHQRETTNNGRRIGSPLSARHVNLSSGCVRPLPLGIVSAQSSLTGEGPADWL